MFRTFYAVAARGGVGVRRRDGEFDLRTPNLAAPHSEPAYYEFGSLAHATEAVVPIPVRVSQYADINALPVVPHTQPKPLFLVTDFHLKLRPL